MQKPLSTGKIIMPCYCHKCKKYFNSLGIARHRAMHRDKFENVKITYSNGDTYNHCFGGPEVPVNLKIKQAESQ